MERSMSVRPRRADLLRGSDRLVTPRSPEQVVAALHEIVAEGVVSFDDSRWITEAADLIEQQAKERDEAIGLLGDVREYANHASVCDLARTEVSFRCEECVAGDGGLNERSTMRLASAFLERMKEKRDG